MYHEHAVSVLKDKHINTQRNGQVFCKRIITPIAITILLCLGACSSGGHLHHPALDEVAVPVKPIGQKEVGQNEATKKSVPQQSVKSRFRKKEPTQKMPPILFGTPSCCL